MEKLETFAYLDAHQSEMCSLLQEFVGMPSCSREPEVMENACRWVCGLLRNEGFRVRTWDGGNSPVIVADIGTEYKGAPVVFSGHYDTALNRELAAKNPFRVEDGKIFGTGVLDMKGGIVIAVYAVRAAIRSGLKRPVRLILAGDEEINHKNARSAEIMMEAAAGALCAFNMETGLLNNQLAVFRKGGTRCKITVHGVEAHAGNDFTKGRNAIVEMAHKILEISALTDLQSGTTMNVGTITGGTIFNAVPARCEIVVDMRFETNDALEDGKKNLAEVCQKTTLEGTSAEMEYLDVMHVFETTEKGKALSRFLQETVSACGLPKPGEIRLGGSSDAAYLTMAGVPTLCSCGAQGEWNHTIREYIRADSLLSRAKMFAAALLHLDSFRA